MKHRQIVNDTIDLWEYNVKFGHNLDIDLTYDPNISIYVVGAVIVFCYIVYIKMK